MEHVADRTDQCQISFNTIDKIFIFKYKQHSKNSATKKVEIA